MDFFSIGPISRKMSKFTPISVFGESVFTRNPVSTVSPRENIENHSEHNFFSFTLVLKFIRIHKNPSHRVYHISGLSMTH